MFNGKNILITFGSYLISILFTSGKEKIEVEKIKNGKSLAKVVNATSTTFLPIIIQTLLCIVGFIVLCVAFGNKEVILPSTIALSIGSVSGQILFSQVKSVNI